MEQAKKENNVYTSTSTRFYVYDPILRHNVFKVFNNGKMKTEDIQREGKEWIEMKKKEFVKNQVALI